MIDMDALPPAVVNGVVDGSIPLSSAVAGSSNAAIYASEQGDLMEYLKSL